MRGALSKCLLLQEVDEDCDNAVGSVTMGVATDNSQVRIMAVVDTISVIQVVHQWIWLTVGA